MTVLSLFAPHRRAAELIDQKLDGAIAVQDAAWLEQHVARCAKCSVVLEDRVRLKKELRSLGGAKAPDGFAGRVMLAAKTRKHVASDEADEGRAPWFSQLAVGASFVVLLAVGLTVLFAVGPSHEVRTKGETAIAGKGLLLAVAPHFIVRAPTLGAAQARREIVKVIEAHGGTHADTGSAILASIPRSALVAVTQDLANRTAFRMTKAEAGELPVDLQMIVIRFELE